MMNKPTLVAPLDLERANGNRLTGGYRMVEAAFRDITDGPVRRIYAHHPALLCPPSGKHGCHDTPLGWRMARRMGFRRLLQVMGRGVYVWLMDDEWEKWVNRR